MNKSNIISEIEGRVNLSKQADYTLSTIGISDKPKTRKDKHENDGVIYKKTLRGSASSSTTHSEHDLN